MTQNATEKIVGEAVFTRKREKHDSPENDEFSKLGIFCSRGGFSGEPC